MFPPEVPQAACETSRPTDKLPKMLRGHNDVAKVFFKDPASLFPFPSFSAAAMTSSWFPGEVHEQVFWCVEGGRKETRSLHYKSVLRGFELLYIKVKYLHDN